MNWHIGQEIVCIKTHSQGLVKRGRIYTIKGLQKGFCPCYHILIDVGIEHSGTTGCVRCNKRMPENTSNAWFGEHLFAPLEYDQQAIEELLEQPIYVEK